MKNFKVEVSRGLEKYHLIRKAETESLLKDELHKEWFTLLSMIAIDNIEVSGNKFYFDILEQNGNIKTGTIVSNDIFKAYLKIKYELKYNLVYIYLKTDASLEEKQKIISELKDHYKLYLETNKKDIRKKQEVEEIKLKNVVEESIDNFTMKKELDAVYKIIDRVLIKIKYFLELNESPYFTFEKKELLKQVYNEVIKLKTSTNIPKLKQIWELALSKVWEIELQILEAKKDEESKKLLSETNKLLREVGSRKSFIEKDKDIVYILNNFWKKIQEKLDSNKKEVKKKVEVDTTSMWFLKNKSLYNKYESKLKELQIEIFKNLYVYFIPGEKNNERKETFNLKKKVIEQNLMILQSRITGKTFSYTKIVKWYKYFIEKMLEFLNFFNHSILIIVVFYSVIFILINILSQLWLLETKINFNGMFYFLYFNILFILLKFTRWILTLSFNIVILSFLFIFWVVNF